MVCVFLLWRPATFLTITLAPGMSGTVVLDDVGDRLPNFVLTGSQLNGSAIKVAKVVNTGEGEIRQVNQ